MKLSNGKSTVARIVQCFHAINQLKKLVVFLATHDRSSKR